MSSGRWQGKVEVAVKQLIKGSMDPEKFLEEGKFMQTLRHSNLVRLYAVVSQEPVYIVTEYMSNGSLIDYMRSGNGINTDLVGQLKMASQVSKVT